MRKFEWSVKAIVAAGRKLREGNPDLGYSDEMAWEMLKVAVKAQPVVALPPCSLCGGDGDARVREGESVGGGGPIGRRKDVRCPSCKGSGAEQLIPVSEIREWIEARRQSFSPYHFPPTAPMVLDELARWLEKRRD